MKIERTTLENFSVFKRNELSFSPGVNVFIGANGTGKSHLLKLLYAVGKAKEKAGPAEQPTGLQTTLPQKLIGIFRPDDDALNRLVYRRVGQASAKVQILTDLGGIAFKVTGKGNFTLVSDSLQKPAGCIFIPSREALAMFEGFVAAYQNRELSFDETYYDLCVALQAAPLRGPRAAMANKLAKPLEASLGGSVHDDKGRFYVYNADGVIEAHLLSEGFRKIASLVRLIQNGSLTSNGLLFWDEPEANLNPKLVTKIAEALRRLAAAGVQVFVSTHDYLLSNELSLAAEYPEQQSAELRCSLKFFALSRMPEQGVTIESGDTLSQLKENPILEEFAAHYDRETQLFQHA